MITCGGGLDVKTLKSTAVFTIDSNEFKNKSLSNAGSQKFLIPKKTKLFIEQTIRERSEAQKIYTTFQQGFLRLRLETARKARELFDERSETGNSFITLQASVLGLGPNFIVKIILTNHSEGLSEKGLFLVFRDENTQVKPRLVKLPLIPSGIPLPITISAVSFGRLPGKINVLLCSGKSVKPIKTINVILPVAEEDIEV